VKQRNGDVVRLGDIADVVLGAENYEQDVRFDGRSATFMGVWVLPTANALEVIRKVRAAMPDIQARLPVGMRAGIPYDSTEYISDAIGEVLKTLSETLLIVILVIFLFLGSWRAVIIPIVAIPISLVGAVFLMQVAGDAEHGLAGWINRRFERVRAFYTRILSETLGSRPVVYVLWGVVLLLIVPFYMFSQRELAPNEDQGVVFGIVQAAPNATLDQTRLFTTAVNDVYRSFPETKNTFQLTYPNGGFGGMVTKPWSERKKSAQQLQME